jgi:hypothetical protein
VRRRGAGEVEKQTCLKKIDRPPDFDETHSESRKIEIKIQTIAQFDLELIRK